MRALLLACAVVATGCGFAVGRFRHPGHGTPIHTVSRTIVSQACGPKGCQTTGTTSITVSDRVSMAVGTANGFGRMKVTSDSGTAIEQTGLNLHVYLDMHYHLSPGLTLAIDGGVDLQNLDDDNKTMLGLQGESESYLAINLIPRIVRTIGARTQIWIGGGRAFGGVGTLEADNWRLNVGLHRIIGKLGVPVMLRLEANAGFAGEHDFSQQTINAGVVFWFKP